VSTVDGNALLHALLDSWDRNNRILVNLLRAIPVEALELRGTPTSNTIAELFMHIHRCRLFFVSEDAPEVVFDRPPAPNTVADPLVIARHLDASAQAVREAVAGHIVAGAPMATRYDHPLLMLQHNLWHEGYHHGQIKLLLKQAGMPLDDEAIGAVTWDVWMDRTT
jgi:uncharacterized damage-inducible protein DinB